MEAVAKVYHVEGYCPFLCCQKEGPHDHSICPACGAVRHGNMFCATCRAYPESMSAEEDGR